jgi:hypothetical protein
MRAIYGVSWRAIPKQPGCRSLMVHRGCAEAKHVLLKDYRLKPVDF